MPKKGDREKKNCGGQKANPGTLPPAGGGKKVPCIGTKVPASRISELEGIVQAQRLEISELKKQLASARQLRALPPSSTPSLSGQAVVDNSNKALKVEDALLYLDQVKMEFVDQPHIYNQFLEVMKDFKSNALGTEAVIAAVSNLFRGHNTLLLGFNRFLPVGRWIELSDDNEDQAAAPPPPPSEEAADQAADQAEEQPPASSEQQQQQQQQRRPGGQVDAINYVTKVRNRFPHDQGKYQTFLKILYKYQQDQTGIRLVLDQIYELFKDEKDLLNEFCQFLPDAVQEQARARLLRAAREEEQRKLQLLRDTNWSRRSAFVSSLKGSGFRRAERTPVDLSSTPLDLDWGDTPEEKIQARRVRTVFSCDGLVRRVVSFL